MMEIGNEIGIGMEIGQRHLKQVTIFSVLRFHRCMLATFVAIK